MNGLIEWFLGFTPGEFAGADGWRLGWLAQFGGMVKLLLVVVFGVLVALTVRSYRREGNAPKTAKAVLASLRITVIVLAFLVLLRPAIVLRFVKELRTQVVILVDDSLSMSLTDRYSQTDRRDMLAESLGITTDDLEALTRQELVAKAFAQEPAVLSYLAEDHPLVFMAFSTNKSDETYTRLLGRFDAEAKREPDVETTAGDTDGAGEGGSGETAETVAAKFFAEMDSGGYETDLARAIRDVLERTRGQRLAAVVVVTDGRQTRIGTAERLEAALKLANERAVPIHAVMVGDSQLRKNLSLAGFDGPEQVRSGAELELEARIAHRNMGGQTVLVKLLSREEGTEVWADTGLDQTIHIPVGDVEFGQEDVGTTDVIFRLEPSQMGHYEYCVQAVAQGDEQDIDDNRSAALGIEVVDEKINILLIGGSPTWEFQYLRNFLSRSSDLYRVSVWQQNADEDVNQTASTGMKLTHLPRSLPELIGVPDDEDRPGYEVVILVDPQPTEGGFDGEFAELLYDYVVTHGGGLCYVAGPKYSDMTLINSMTFKKLADMLPVTLASNTITDVARIREVRPKPYPVQLTSYGREHPIMRLGTSREETAGAWAVMPGLYWMHPVYQIKPGARVLAEHSDLSRSTVRKAREPFIAIQSPGVGNVVYIGANATWRWRAVSDGYYHRRFWSNTIRYLASGEAAKRVTFSLGADAFVAGDAIKIEVEAFDADFMKLDSPTKTYEVALLDMDRDEVSLLELDQVEPGRFTGFIGPEHTHRTGRFRLTVPGVSEAQREQIAEREFRIELPRAEMVRKEADAQPLRLIGRRTSAASEDGNFLMLEQRDQLIDRIAPDRRNMVDERPVELWDTKLMLILIALLLTTEWALRKRYHMA